MNVINPVEVNDTTLTSSTVAEPDIASGEVEWDSGAIDVTTAQDSQYIAHGLGKVWLASDDFGSPAVYRFTELLVDDSFSFSPSTEITTVAGITTDDTYIYILDAFGDAVYRYDAAGVYQAFTFSVASETTAPSSIYWDGSHFYVGLFSLGNSDFARYDSLGAFVDYWSYSEPYTTIGGIVSAQGFVFINDQSNDKIVKCDTDGLKIENYIDYSNRSDLIASVAFFNGQFNLLSPDIASVFKYFYSGSAVSSYVKGDVVIKSSTHRKYQAAVTTVDDPELGVDADPVPSWVDVGPSNRYAPFDELSNTQSFSENLIVEITPGVLSGGLACFNLSGATSINITMTDPIEGEVYNKDIQILNFSQIVNWYAYLFNPVTGLTELAIFDLPPYKSATIKLTFTGANVGVGSIVTGPVLKIGETVHGTSIREIDLNTYADDGFGNIKVTKRPSAKLVNFKVALHKDLFSSTINQLAGLSGKGAVYASDTTDANDFTLVYGIRRDHELTADTPTINIVPIQVRGFT